MLLKADCAAPDAELSLVELFVITSSNLPPDIS